MEVAIADGRKSTGQVTIVIKGRSTRRRLESKGGVRGDDRGTNQRGSKEYGIKEAVVRKMNIMEILSILLMYFEI